MSVSDLMKAILEQNEIDAPAPAKSVPRPTIASTAKLLPRNKKWESVVWTIDSAEALGRDALQGLAVAYGRIIQALQLRTVLEDARQGRQASIRRLDLMWEPPKNEPGLNWEELPRSADGWLQGALAKTIVFASPRETFRLCKALDNIGPGRPHGKWRQDDNHHFIAWAPWPILWAENGNHSTMAGVLKGEGSFSAEYFDATPILQAVRTDGSKWIEAATGDAFAPVDSLEMAAIFEIGRRLVGAR